MIVNYLAILILIFFTLLSECTQYSDCPNGGQNYECIDDLCTCANGYALDGDACVGMLPNIYLFTSKATFLTVLASFVNYGQLAWEQNYHNSFQ